MLKHKILPILLSVAAIACGGNKKVQETLPEIPVMTLKDTSCILEMRYPAIIQGIRDVDIFPQVEGRIMEVKVVEGQYVEKGQTLFVIDDVPYLASYNSAEADLAVSKSEAKTAELTLASKQNLYDQNIISEYQLNLAKNNLATANAKVEQARAKLTNAANSLSFTRVNSLVSGYIGNLPYKVGSLVGATMTKPLTTVSDNSQIYADFSIPENIWLTIADNVGDMSKKDWGKRVPPLSLITNDGTKYDHKGYLHSVSGLISRETGAITARSLFPNPERVLLSGGSCQVVFAYNEDGVILVPRTAIKELQNKMFIFTVGADSTLTQLPVRATRYNDTKWAILPDENGNMPVKSGDVITTMTNRLRSEAKICPIR